MTNIRPARHSNPVLLSLEPQQSFFAILPCSAIKKHSLAQPITIKSQSSLGPRYPLEATAFIYLFIYSFIHLFIYSFIHLFIYSFIHLFIYSFIYLFIYSFIHLFIYSFIHLFNHIFCIIYSSIHSFIYSYFIYSFLFIRPSIHSLAI